ncbi:MAG: 50S ribosomal protein L4 [Planctomycetes bacterium]|nr:50S ribosomal protein L4 [Planctomycetota bacterium]
MIDVPVHDRQGKVVETIQFDETCLGRVIHVELLHQAIVRHEANQRVGTASTKNRSEVVGTTKKPWRQKGLGRARVGTKRNPVWRGGGVVFGPKPRSYRQKLSKKARRTALKSALLSKLRDGEIKVITDLQMDQPKTKEIASILSAIGACDRCLIVLREQNENTYKSTRNLPQVELTTLQEMNAYTALLRKNIVMTKDAFTAIPEEIK